MSFNRIDLRMRRGYILPFLITCWLFFLLSTGKAIPVSESPGEYGIHFYVGLINMIMALLIFLLSPSFRSAYMKGLLIILPIFILLLFYSLGSRDSLYAIKKIEGAVFATVLTASICAILIKKLGETRFIDYFVKITALYLVAAVIQRSYQGIEGREGLFLFNGPIVFGWLIGLGSIFSLYNFLKTRKLLYLLLYIIFLVGIIWVQSKGPLLAAIILSIIVYFYKTTSSRPLNLTVNGFFVVLLLLLYYIAQPFLLEVITNSESRFSALFRLYYDDLAATDDGSIGIRMMLLQESIEIFQQNPIFGIGIGNFQFHTAYSEFRYPHNLIAEVGVEFGMIGLTIFMIFGIFIWLRVEILHRFIMLYFLICLLFSGDLSYWRLLLFYPLSCFIIHSGKLSRSKVDVNA